MKYLPDMEVIQSDVMDKVREAAKNYDYSLYTEADVRRALSHDYKTPEDFKAPPFTGGPSSSGGDRPVRPERDQETFRQFHLYVYPIYIANYCENYCIYCGF